MAVEELVSIPLCSVISYMAGSFALNGFNFLLSIFPGGKY
jgi:hypothetical protein